MEFHKLNRNEVKILEEYDNLLFLDFETTGFSEGKDFVWQAGIVEYKKAKKSLVSHKFDFPCARYEYPETTYRIGHIFRTLKDSYDEIYGDTASSFYEYVGKEVFMEQFEVQCS